MCTGLSPRQRQASTNNEAGCLVVAAYSPSIHPRGASKESYAAFANSVHSPSVFRMVVQSDRKGVLAYENARIGSAGQCRIKVARGPWHILSGGAPSPRTCNICHFNGCKRNSGGKTTLSRGERGYMMEVLNE